MAFSFESEQTRFLTQYRNGNLFTDNPTEFSDRIRGDVTDKLRYSEIIGVEITVNGSESLTFNYDGSGTSGKINAPGVNFVNEGLFVGAVVDVCQGEDVGESTIEIITGGSTYNTIELDKTNLGFLEDGPHTNVIIKVKTSPDSLTYKYGLIKNDVTGISESNYASPLDGNPQAYYQGDIGLIFGPMTKLGGFNSWNQTQDLQIKFLNIVDTYTHRYEIRHDFQIQYFKDGEQDNVTDLINPDNLSGTATYKYANGYFLGNASVEFSKFEKLGLTGKVGYFNENYNGQPDIFSINTIDFINDFDSGTIEVSLTNTISVNITSSVPAFAVGQKVIVGHSLLTDEDSYSDSVDTFDEVFLRDSIAQLDGAIALSSTIIKNLTVTFNSNVDIDVDFEVEFTADQQEQILSTSQYVLWFTVGDESFSVDLENQVNQRYTALYSSSTDTPGLISSFTPSYFDAFGAYAGTKFGTDYKGWNGDLVGFSCRFNLIQFNDGSFTRITDMKSRVIVVNSVTGDEFKLFTKSVPVEPFTTVEGSGYSYQALDISTKFTTKLPPDSPINQVTVISGPPFPLGFQTINVQSALPRIPWRDFLFNGTVPGEFYDDTEPNNNRNFKSSNYNNIGNWLIHHELVVTVVKSTLATSGFLKSVPGVPTEYKLRSDHFDIVDFGVDPGGVWSGQVRIFDFIGDEATEGSTNQPNLIKVECFHNLGILPVQDIWGRIWMTKKGVDETPWELLTDQNWTHASNPLIPSQVLTAANITVVEVESLNNQVNFYCATNPDNIPAGVRMVRGRAGKQTP